ncbi:hypothetical protein CDO52_03940 [Nocardiopsis gilva YIM 90087]|uniref:Uncharacterized protein n=2 Tax=Nocardiopsis gilva TaxID=280236 RepID=A0A223SD51_9ACTN|nr:hypothetical protein [Nocardiopsis gilva]ASU86016.1 hypothetical protein CDO52_03940 [Nocardiopsis gilva YIM 90087]
MELKFLGIYPDTPDDGSPTIWLDKDTGDLVIQSYKADEATVRECQRVGSVPGHSTDVPEHETVVRLPANMLQFIPRSEGEVGSGNGGT